MLRENGSGTTMKVKLLLLLLTVCAHYEANQDPAPVYDKNNPLDAPADVVFLPLYGIKYDIYKNEANREVKNLLIPLSGYADREAFAYNGHGIHPPIYYNLIENGVNLGQYVLLPDNKLHRINDGRDSTADYPSDSNEFPPKEVYIGASDGIYVFNPDTKKAVKYGNLTADILAIDKVTNKDILYILTTDNKIYKVTEHGTIKTRVEAIEYATDFVLDWAEGIFYSGRDNKLHYLHDENSIPHKFEEFKFDVKNAVLGRPMFGWFHNDKDSQRSVPYIVDGVPYIVLSNSSIPLPEAAYVPGVTAFDAQFVFKHYYAVDGEIYEHDVLGHKEDSYEYRSGSNKKNKHDKKTKKPTNPKILDRDLNLEFNNFKEAQKWD